MKKYFFNVTYLEGSVFKTHAEKKAHKTFDDALQHFRNLLAQYKVDGGSYYLCEWGTI